MIWRLMHALFGGDYVHCKNTATSIIRRIHHTPAGERYVVYSEALSFYEFIDRPNCGWVVTELTAHPLHPAGDPKDTFTERLTKEIVSAS